MPMQMPFLNGPIPGIFSSCRGNYDEYPIYVIVGFIFINVFTAIVYSAVLPPLLIDCDLEC